MELEKPQVPREAVAVHEANAPLGGQVTRIPVADFLNRNTGKPEYEALLQILSQSHPRPESQLIEDEGETSCYATAMRYLDLGGRRRAKVGDNSVTTRSWEQDPSEAEAFRQSNSETLDEKGRRDVALHLPSISER